MEKKNGKLGLIGAAWDLFTSKGYENTTVRDILSRVNLAKGTFYHYFTSKEAILNDVTEHIISRQVEAFKEKLQGEDIGATGRLYLLFDHLKTWKLKNTIFMRTLLRTVYSEQNLKLRHHMVNKMVDLLSPILADIFDQGIREGVFRMDFPHETAQLVLQMGFAVGASMAREVLAIMEDPGDTARIERVLRLFGLYFASIEKLIGADQGVFDPVSDQDLFTLLGVSPGTVENRA